MAAGLTNATTVRTSRTVGEIVRANVFTVFNGLLAALFVLVMTTGRWQNALFGGVVVANAAIGIVQELRAKRTLDRLAVLNAPRARVVREGSEQDLPVADVVLDDLLVLVAGDQVPADGVVRSLERTVGRRVAADRGVRAGRQGRPATRCGRARSSSPAAGCAAGDGRRGRLLRGPAGHRGAPVHHDLLRAGRRHQPAAALDRDHAARRRAGGAVEPVPHARQPGLAGRGDRHGRGAGRHGPRGAGAAHDAGVRGRDGRAWPAGRSLVQELPAVEGLARVDVVCLDKTGTLTHGDVAVRPAGAAAATAADAAGRARSALLAAADRGQRDRRGAGRGVPGRRRPRRCDGAVPFSSARKWSAVRAGGRRRPGCSARPEMVLPGARRRAHPAPRERAPTSWPPRGAACCCSPARRAPRATDGGDAVLPAALAPVSLVVLAERIREDAARGARLLHRPGRGAEGDLRGQPPDRRGGRGRGRRAGRARAPGTPSTRGTCPRTRDALADGDGGRHACSAGSPRTRSGPWCGRSSSAATSSR